MFLFFVSTFNLNLFEYSGEGGNIGTQRGGSEAWANLLLSYHYKVVSRQHLR